MTVEQVDKNNFLKFKMNILEQILEVKRDEVSELRKRMKVTSFADSEFFDEKALSLYNSREGIRERLITQHKPRRIFLVHLVLPRQLRLR